MLVVINIVVMFIFEAVLHLQSMFAFAIVSRFTMQAQKMLVISVLRALQSTYAGRFADI